MNNKVIITPVSKTQQEILELWENIFSTPTKRDHINKLVPNKTEDLGTLFQFIKNSGTQNSIWVIREVELGTAVGCLIHDKEFYGHRDSIGFFVGNEYCNNGYGRDAVSQFLPILKRSGINEVSAITYGTNNPSRKLLKKLEFHESKLGTQPYSDGHIVFKYTKKLI